MLYALNSFNADPVFFFVNELVNKVEDQCPCASRFLNIRTKNSDDGVYVLADDLICRKIARDIDMTERSAIRLMGLDPRVRGS